MTTRISGGDQVQNREFTTTATGNVDDLDFSNAGTIRMNNATLATIRGLKAGIAGQRVIIAAVGAGQVNLSHQDAGDATAGSRLINFVTGGPTPLAAGTGSATLEYDATTARWRLVTHVQGAAISVPYNAGDYTASAGTWDVDAGDIADFRYIVHGTLMTVAIQIDTSTVSASPAQLRVAIPSGLTAGSTSIVQAFAGNGAGLTSSASLQSLTGQTFVFFNAEPLGTATFSPVTNTQQVRGTVTFAIQ